MYFKKAFEVAYNDCDVNDNLKLSAAIRMMQQTSSEHLAKVNASVEQLMEEGMVFLLTKTCVKIHQLPQAMEQVKVGTTAVKVKGPRFYREFTMEDVKGFHYMDALTLWILVEPKTRRIIRPRDYPYTMPFLESITQGAIDDIPIPKAPEQESSFSYDKVIRYSLLDVNEHVNNTYYADFVCDALPYDLLTTRGIDTMAVEFQHEALREDTLSMRRYDLGEKEYLLEGLHQRGSCFRSYATIK